MGQLKYQNRHLPPRARIGRTLEKWAGIPFNLFELVLSYIFVRPWQFLLSSLDALSYKIEGTLFKEIVSHLLFPVTLIITYFLGVELAKDGFTINSLAGFSLILLGYGLIFAPMERLFPWSREWLDGGNDSAVDFMMFYSSAICNAVAKFFITVLALSFLIDKLEPYGHQYWPSFLPDIVEVFLFLLLKDFLRYWFHRAHHEIPFLWRFHSVHHSVERLYWMNGLRTHPGEIIMQALFFAIPVALLQPGADIVLIAVFMALSIGIFQHSNIGIKLGFWEYIFSIGDNHRYHHYPDDIGNSNYGGEFIVWDILFGTFHKPKGETPSDKIGIAKFPNYPMTWTGLMIAPFMPDQSVFGPEKNMPEELEASTDSNQAEPI